MTRLEISTEYTDGRSAVEDVTERDDPRGRRETDRRASILLERSDVIRVTVERVDRAASATGKGSYR